MNSAFDPTVPRALYDPTQPRNPAGAPGGGQWTKDGFSATLPIEKLKKKLPVVTEPRKTRFLLPDGTRLGALVSDNDRHRTHEEMIQAAGLTREEVYEAGVVRVLPHAGVEIHAPLTEAQATIIADDFLEYAQKNGRGFEMYDVDVVFSNRESAGNQFEAAETSASTLRSWVNNKFREHSLRANYDANQPRNPAGSPGGGQWTAFHGTTLAAAKAIVQEGIRPDLAGRVWPGKAQPGTTYVTNSLDDATDWAGNALSIRRGDTSPDSLIPVVIAFTIPEAERARFIRDANAVSNAFQTSQIIPPEWIEAIYAVRRKGHYDSWVGHPVKDGAITGLAAGTTLYAVVFFEDSALRTLFDASQPRVPAGSPGGGQWVGDGMRPQAAPDSPEFKAWFAGSKVIDANGKPLVVFHGRATDRTEFDTNRVSTALNPNQYWSGDLGTWFAAPSKHQGNYDEGNAEEQAAMYTEKSDRMGYADGYKKGAHVVPAYLSIKNPKEYEGYDDFNDARIPHAQANKLTGKQLKEKLIKQGYDGVVIRNSMTDGDTDRDDWVAFYPEQIKSLWNRGTWSPKSKNISLSQRILYDAMQPRVPAGAPGGGRWTDGGIGSGMGGGDVSTDWMDNGPPPEYSATVQRLRGLLPKNKGLGDTVHVALTPNALAAAKLTADVLEEMKAKGYVLPNKVRVEHEEFARAEVRHVPGSKETTLNVFIPSTLTNGVDLDSVVEATFGGTEKASDGKWYDMFAVRTMKDAIVHEMGHAQDVAKGNIRHDKAGNPKPNMDAHRQVADALKAQRQVSIYGSGDDGEFVAEAFTRLYRGETLSPDSLKLYTALNGPRIFTRKPNLLERIIGVTR